MLWYKPVLVVMLSAINTPQKITGNCQNSVMVNTVFKHFKREKVNPVLEESPTAVVWRH